MELKYLFLVVGLVAVVFLIMLVEIPSDLTQTATITVTTTKTTTVTVTNVTGEAVNHWPYSLNFNEYGCGPEGQGYNLAIQPNGVASIYGWGQSADNRGTRDYRNGLLLSQPELDNLTSLFLRVNVSSLKEDYPLKGDVYDACMYGLGVRMDNKTKFVRWGSEVSLLEPMPKELREITTAMDNIADKMTHSTP